MRCFFLWQLSAANVHYSTFLIRCSTFVIQHSTFHSNLCKSVQSVFNFFKFAISKNFPVTTCSKYSLQVVTGKITTIGYCITQKKPPNLYSNKITSGYAVSNIALIELSPHGMFIRR